MAASEAHINLRRPGKTPAVDSDIDLFIRLIRSGSRGSDHLYVLLLGIKSLEAKALRSKIEKGLPYRAFESLRRNMMLTSDELAGLAQINYRTLGRRKKTGKLEPDESDRVVRVGRIFARALELFDGDRKAAIHWLMSPQRALGNEVPSNLSKTEFGALEVERLIGRLEHGVFT